MNRREAIREANIASVISGMERDALLLAQKRIDYLLELNDTLISALQSVNPMTRTAHRDECPSCLGRNGEHRFGCKIGRAEESYREFNGHKGVGTGIVARFFD